MSASLSTRQGVAGSRGAAASRRLSKSAGVRAPTVTQIAARCASTDRVPSAQASRRGVLELAGAAAMVAASPLPALAEKTPKGFLGLVDKGDGYQFFYPFGWQEVTVPGQDVVYKDVIEPLESVSVNVLDVPDKNSIRDYGDLNEVAFTLADKVLTAPNQEVKIIATQEEEYQGVAYYIFEFTVTASNYKRHALAAVTVNNHKFYTMLTGSNERRWKKVQDKVKAMVGSFSTFEILQ